MADGALEFLLNNLRDLVVHHGQLIGNAKSQVEDLEKDLGQFKAFLKETTKTRRTNEVVADLVRQIRDVVYEAEDLVDTFVTEAAVAASMTKAKKLFTQTLNLHSIALNVGTISSKVKKIRGDKSMIDFAQITFADGEPEINEAPIVREENIVGFEDEAAKLIGYLKEEKEDDVISIIGMPGLGKTTLAGMIFRDPTIHYDFPTRIWIYISQEFTSKNVFLSILKKLTTVSDDMSKKTDQELAQILVAHLQKKKFLIVMDDVWTSDDWDKLKIALPTTNSMGKVLITSRHVEVGRSANHFRVPHPLRFLNNDESWLLLRYEVFGKPDPQEGLERFGKLIVNKCANLPLAIVIIGGILVKKTPGLEDESATRKTWETVSEHVNTLIVADDPKRRMEKIIALSYDKLPYHLRSCFLYLGMFPEDIAIPAWKLIRMWMAEGFIQQKGSFSLEGTAENYLDEIINRNLLRVDKRARDGKVKTCRIHDMLRDFCRSESERESFFQEMNMNGELVSRPGLQKARRLCIHSNVIDFVKSEPKGHHVRSFVCFSNEDDTIPVKYNASILAGFKLLRVFEVNRIKFHKIPTKVNHLVHLRYIALSFNLATLPAAFDKLWNLESLIVDTTEHILEIKADIWKMKQFRHLKTNASATLLKPGKDNVEGGNIQTLGTISPESCTEVVFKRAPNMKKLGIRGELAILTKNRSLDSLGNLSNLEKLKLINDMFTSASSSTEKFKLPQAHQFPQKLTSLTLAETLLNWEYDMSTLGLLKNLEVLKLEDRAFMGNSWVVADGGFLKLEVLYIGQTNLIVWMASKQHFQSLNSLELRNCEKLQEVPIEFAEIPQFNMLSLYCTNDAAAASAKKISTRKEELIQGEKFKLSIYPPHV